MAEAKKPARKREDAAKPKAAGAARAKAAARPAGKAAAERPRAAKAAPKAAKPAAPKAVAKAPVRRAVARPARVVRREAPAPRAEVAPPRPKPVETRPLPSAPAGQAPLIAADGSLAGTLELPAVLADAKRRPGVLFQAVVAAEANARQANAATRNRSRVRGGGAKPWRQKGTGRARQGSTRSPQWRHGAVVFGPNGRRYEQRIPEKMRRAAFAEAVAARASEGRVLVFDGWSNGDRPRTRALVDWLGRIGDTGRALLVTAGADEAVSRAAANAAGVEARSVGALQLMDVLRNDTLLVRRDALAALAARAGGQRR